MVGCSVRGVLFLLVLSGFSVRGLVVGEVLCWGEGVGCRVCVFVFILDRALVMCGGGGGGRCGWRM